jgi:uncharacterized SAM-binding protein YcdF (DUF218 family)
MFFVSKIVALLAQPLHWVIALLALGLLLPRRAIGLSRTCQATALTMLLLIGWEPLPDLLIRPLEQKYPEIPPAADLSAFDGAVVLGGALESGTLARNHTQPLLNDAAERMTAASALAQKFPRIQMVFTGGEGEIFGTGPSEAERAATFFGAMGHPAARFVFEDRSRNTYENAVFTAEIAGVNKRKNWLLITSAWHMPRAMATFEKTGWHVTPYPVDFRTGEETPWTHYSLARGAELWQLAIREWIGIAAYRLTGRSQ